MQVSRIKKLEFAYLAKSRPFDYVSTVCSLMQMYSDTPEQILSAGFYGPSKTTDYSRGAFYTELLARAIAMCYMREI